VALLLEYGRCYAFTITNGKDTTGSYEDSKQRETWLPVEVEATINRYVQQADLRDDDPLLGGQNARCSTGLRRPPTKLPKKQKLTCLVPRFRI
jgi:hypothetical protein